MSLPHLSPLTLPSGQRRIAPLPLRARSRSSGTTPPLHSGLPETDQALSTASDILHQPRIYQSPEVTLTARHLSPPAQDVPRIAFQPSESGSDSIRTEDQETYTYRLLHNVTPRPSPEPEEIPRPFNHGSPAALDDSPFPERVTPENEILQPLHTMYSDEKIAIPAASDPQERDSSAIIEDYSDIAAGTPGASSTVMEPLLTSTRVSDLSQSLGGLRLRSVSDVSDISGYGESNDSAGAYDVRDEEAPLEPFFSLAFQSALQKGLRIANKVATAIEECVGSSEASGDLERLLDDAKRLGTFQSSDTRTIAVLGDSGEGKSSLINSLLHCPEIAKTGDIGAACTSVVTEYRQKTSDHTAPITIEAEYLSQSEIENLIKELLWNYRQIFLPEIEEDSVDSKEYARYERESEQAWSALEAGFQHQRGFNKQLLSDMTEGGLVKATDQLIQWAHELEWPQGGSSGVWKAIANNAEECCEMTSIFMEDRFWPFTKIIRVYLNAQVLKTGVVLADLPGLQDTNLARVRATQTYLMKCDNIFIVTKISRAITDQSLKSSLYSILARHAPVEWEESGAKSLNLAVVCTKSEDINQKTARREFCGPDKAISPQVIEQLDKDIEDAKKRNNKYLKKQLKRKQEFLFVDARNNHVKEGLQRAYSSKVPGGKLEVFCVSNTTYEKFSSKGNAEMVRSSGIPELRRFCHTITAGAQLREAKHFLQSTLSSLLSSVELWASSSPSQPQVEDHGRDESIRNLLSEVTSDVSNKISQSRAEFRQNFREVLSEYLEQRNHYWEVAAKAKGLEWTQWHWSQYNAWCLRRGNHETKKRGFVNWNSELIWKMRTELAFQWGLVDDEIPTVFKELLQFTRLCFSRIRCLLGGKLYVDHGLSESLVQGIKFRVQDIVYKFELLQRHFTREVKLIQRYASETNDSSYVVSEMLPAYREAAEQSGDEKAARQRAIVQGRITNGTLFPHISAKIQSDIDQLVEKTFRVLHGSINKVLHLIVTDIEMALASAPEPVDNARNQGDSEEERKEKLMAEIKELNEAHEDLLATISSI